MNDREVLGLFDDLEDRFENLQKLTATGHIFASGDVWIDSDGISLRGEDYTSTAAANTVKWYYDDSGTDRILGEFYGDYYPTPWFKGSAWMIARRGAGDPWTNGTVAIVAAIDDVTAADVRLSIDSSGLFNASGGYVFLTDAPIRPGTGTADPVTSIEDGMLFYRTDTNKLRLRANGAWVNLN